MTVLPVLPVLADAAVPCCGPLGEAPLSEEQAADLARRLKALADPARLRLLSMILASENGEACVCELTEPLGLSQGTVSHHLKVLLDVGVVSREKRGVWAYYSACPAALAAVTAVLAPSGSSPRAGCS
jgi:ArsR family transcriptional regulator